MESDFIYFRPSVAINSLASSPFSILHSRHPSLSIPISLPLTRNALFLGIPRLASAVSCRVVPRDRVVCRTSLGLACFHQRWPSSRLESFLPHTPRDPGYTEVPLRPAFIPSSSSSLPRNILVTSIDVLLSLSLSLFTFWLTIFLSFDTMFLSFPLSFLVISNATKTLIAQARSNMPNMSMRKKDGI